MGEDRQLFQELQPVETVQHMLLWDLTLCSAMPDGYCTTNRHQLEWNCRCNPLIRVIVLYRSCGRKVMHKYHDNYGGNAKELFMFSWALLVRKLV